MVVAIVVRNGRDYTDEMYILGEGLKTTQEMRKYRHVTYNPDLYYDKQSGEVVDQASHLREKVYKDALQIRIKEEVLNQDPLLRALRRG